MWSSGSAQRWSWTASGSSPPNGETSSAAILIGLALSAVGIFGVFWASRKLEAED